MKRILIKYNISEERSQEIMNILYDIEDFQLLSFSKSALQVIKSNVQKHLKLTAKNEIDFINEFCEITFYENKLLIGICAN